MSPEPGCTRSVVEAVDGMAGVVGEGPAAVMACGPAQPHRSPRLRRDQEEIYSRCVVRARYDAVADFYVSGFDATDDPASVALLDLLGPVAGLRVPDVACVYWTWPAGTDASAASWRAGEPR